MVKLELNVLLVFSSEKVFSVIFELVHLDYLLEHGYEALVKDPFINVFVQEQLLTSQNSDFIILYQMYI